MKSGTGKKIYLGAIVSDIAFQMAIAVALVAIMVINGVTDVNDIPYYSTINLVAMIFLQGGFALAIFIVLKKQKDSLPLRPAVPTIKHAALAVLCGLISVTCFSWICEWFIVLLDGIGYNFTDIDVNGTLDIILVIVATVIIAPIVEETVFRNALFGNLRRQSGDLVAVLVSGVAFSLMHMNPQQTFYQFFLGCVCGFVVLKTGNIVCAMIVHAVNNACAIALMFVDIPLLKAADGQVSVLTSNPALSVPVTIGLAIVGAVAVLGLGKLLGNKHASEVCREDTAEKGGKIVLIAPMIICALMWITTFIGSL